MNIFKKNFEDHEIINLNFIFAKLLFSLYNNLFMKMQLYKNIYLKFLIKLIINIDKLFNIKNFDIFRKEL